MELQPNHPRWSHEAWIARKLKYSSRSAVMTSAGCESRVGDTGYKVLITLRRDDEYRLRLATLHPSQRARAGMPKLHLFLWGYSIQHLSEFSDEQFGGFESDGEADQFCRDTHFCSTFGGHKLV